MKAFFTVGCYISMFPQFLQRETSFNSFCLLSRMTNPSEKVFTLKEENLLHQEQKREFAPPLRVDPP